MQIGIASALADGFPADGVNHANEQVQRHLEALGDVIGEQLQGLTHQGVPSIELPAYLVQPGVRQAHVLRAGEQQREGDSLGVAVGEGGVVGSGEKKLAPVTHQAGEPKILRARPVGSRTSLGLQLL